MSRTLLGSFAVLCFVWGTVEADAQVFRWRSNSQVYNVPHTTTHIDYYQHGNHIDAVPHTTTHVDQVYGTTPYQSHVSGSYHSNRPVGISGGNHGNAYYSTQGQVVYPSNGVYSSNYAQPYQSYGTAYPHVHQSTHIDYVPHTQTHIDYYQHGNHVDAVPHTTTHYDAVPHTTSHLHIGH